MTQDIDDETALAMGGQARVELDQTERAFTELRAKMIEEAVGTKIGETALREKLILGVQVLDIVRKTLTDLANGADMIRAIERMKEEAAADQ